MNTSPSETHTLCEVVQTIPPGAANRCWKLRADYPCAGGSHHHSKGVKLSESPLYLNLNWRRNRGGSVRHVGVFRLDLNKLLRDGYIRFEKTDGPAASVRLRIFRADDGKFFVQTKAAGPALYFAADIP